MLGCNVESAVKHCKYQCILEKGVIVTNYPHSLCLSEGRTLGVFSLPSALGVTGECRHSQEAKSCVASGTKEVKSKIIRSVSLIIEFHSHGMTLVRNLGPV